MFTLDKVVRFRGTQESWELKKSSDIWNNTIVFGKVYLHGAYKYKIYAGKANNPDESGIPVEFEYDIATAEQFDSLVARIAEIELLININNGRFTNERFITAIEYIIHDVTNPKFNMIDTSINIIELAISWHLEEDENN